MSDLSVFWPVIVGEKKTNVLMLAFFFFWSLYNANENERPNFGVHFSSSSFFFATKLKTKICVDIRTRWLR